MAHFTSTTRIGPPGPEIGAINDIYTDKLGHSWMCVTAAPNARWETISVSVGWNDIVSELTTRGGANSPSVTQLAGGIYAYEFDKTTVQEVFANFHIPHDYSRGTMIYPHIHFTTTSNLAGNVRWGFEYTWARRHESSGQLVFPATTTSYVTFAIPVNSAMTHFVAELPEGQGIDGTNIEPDVVIMTRIFRDASNVADNFDATVHGITVDLHYQSDRINTPNRTPDYYA